ncbi:MAG: hypothetical protein R3F22_03445 [Lysobacteraceae bacterium]
MRCIAALGDDARVGLSHFNRWERNPVLADLEWPKPAVQGMGFLMPAAARVLGRDDFGQTRRGVSEACNCPGEPERAQRKLNVPAPRWRHAPSCPDSLYEAATMMAC